MELEVVILFMRIIAIILALGTGSILLAPSSIFAGQTEVDLADKARMEIAKAGVGKDARVEVELKDKTKIKGYVAAVEAEAFTVFESNTSRTRSIAYSDVTKVSRKTNGFWTPTKMITAGAVGAGLIITWIVVKPALCDGGAQNRFPC